MALFKAVLFMRTVAEIKFSAVLFSASQQSSHGILNRYVKTLIKMTTKGEHGEMT